MGLPNVYDYIHKHRERLMEEKRQKLLAHEVRRTQHQQQEQGQMRQNPQIGPTIPTPPPLPHTNENDSNNNRRR
jgi:kelch-like protein 10